MLSLVARRHQAAPARAAGTRASAWEAGAGLSQVLTVPQDSGRYLKSHVSPQFPESRALRQDRHRIPPLPSCRGRVLVKTGNLEAVPPQILARGLAMDLNTLRCYCILPARASVRISVQMTIKLPLPAGTPLICRPALPAFHAPRSPAFPPQNLEGTLDTSSSSFLSSFWLSSQWSRTCLFPFVFFRPSPLKLQSAA